MRLDRAQLADITDFIEELLTDNRHQKKSKSQQSRRPEGDVSTRCQRHAFSCLGIPSKPSFALDDVEGPETRQLHVFATHQTFLDASQNQFHQILRLCEGNSSVPLVNNLSNVRFYHSPPSETGSILGCATISSS
jgi:hypothetical protein